MLKNIFKKIPKIKGVPISDVKQYFHQRPCSTLEYFCAAPFKSMLFIQNGDVKVCHYNRGMSIGNYPKMSLIEIWNGAALNRIQDGIKSGDLSQGCFDCRNFLLKKNYESVPASRYDFLAKFKPEEGYPVMLDFQLTNTCNLECIMCSGEYSSSIRKNREKGKAYHEPWDNAFIEQLKNFIPHIKAASFTGGEPFASEIYFSIWNLIKKINPSIDIFVSTNATILNDKIKEILQSLKFNFTISIDSVVKETYETIRKNACFETTMQNISWIENYCKTNNRSFSIKACIIKNNFQEIPEFINFWNDKNCVVYPKLVWFPPYLSIRKLSQDELKYISNYYENFKFSENTNIQKGNIRFFKGICSQINEWTGENRESPKNKLTFFSTKELKEMLIKNISDYINSHDEIKEKELFYKKEIEEIICCEKDEVNLKNALLNFINISPSSIIAEIDRNTPEKLKERFKAAGKE